VIESKGNLREGREVAVLGLELDELREEGERLVGGAHGDGAADGGHDGEEPEEDVGDGYRAADAARRHRRRHQGRLGALPVLDHRALRHGVPRPCQLSLCLARIIDELGEGFLLAVPDVSEVVRLAGCCLEFLLLGDVTM
jgi:hypothetical protein